MLFSTYTYVIALLCQLYISYALIFTESVKNEIRTIDHVIDLHRRRRHRHWLPMLCYGYGTSMGRVEG
jgi:hypothetical protein